MSLWGPAVEAEIEYRQAEVKKAWGRQGRSGADRADRAERRSEHRALADRAEQIREGIAGMRPAATTRHGLFA
ncbi:hypothetical protein [Promicromonospora sp. NPDC060271]|uniref:hypothetical protein n=1 Tax=Promicromonospora sp. NPDC060271 TaxID=3347089 RepID=UPI0036511948